MSGILLSNSTGALVDKSKGSTTNRLKCSASHFTNTAKSYAQAAAGTIGAVVIGGGIAQRGITNSVTFDTVKNAKGLVEKINAAMQYCIGKIAIATKNWKFLDRASSKFSNVFDTIANGIYKGASKISGKPDVIRNSKGQFTKTLPDWLKHIRSWSKNQKAGAVVMGVGILSAIITAGARRNHKRGQIDQKYTDKAKLKNTDIVNEKAQRKG